MSATDRHTPISVIQKYLDQSLQGIFAVAGTPAAQIVVDSAHATLAIRVPVAGPAPDLTELKNLTCTTVLLADRYWYNLSVRADGRISEVYPLMCGIVDRVQLDGMEFAPAVVSALAALRELLEEHTRLSAEAQVGLFAELTVLLALVAASGPEDALTAWRGPFREEHDFGLREVDVEVKATRGEKRCHWISGLTQLVPTPKRDLYVLSLQLTTAAVGSGSSLPELVDALRLTPEIAVDRLNAAMLAAQYDDRDAQLYGQRWALRTRPAFFIVDRKFPAITPAILADALISPARVVDLRYRIDLDDLLASPPVFPVFFHPCTGEIA